MVESFIGRTDVLDDEAPFARPLVVVYAQTSIVNERIETNRQRMNTVLTTPYHLGTYKCNYRHRSLDGSWVHPYVIAYFIMYTWGLSECMVTLWHEEQKISMDAGSLPATLSKVD